MKAKDKYILELLKRIHELEEAFQNMDIRNQCDKENYTKQLNLNRNLQEENASLRSEVRNLQNGIRNLQDEQK